MIIEFRAARAGWERWQDHPATAEEQRQYGRRWRWTRLWEMIWDRWVDRGQVHSLTEFIKLTERFWHPLLACLDDPCEYDPAIEIVWEDALTDGPQQLVDWPRVVHESWTAPVMSTCPATTQSPAPEKDSAEAPRTAKSRGPKLIETGLAETDAILMDWCHSLQDQGLSVSRAQTLRRRVAQAIIETGLPLKALPDRQWDRDTTLAISRMHQWLQTHQHQSV